MEGIERIRKDKDVKNVDNQSGYYHIVPGSLLHHLWGGGSRRGVGICMWDTLKPTGQ